jgi:hypothetical protein
MTADSGSQVYHSTTSTLNKHQLDYLLDPESGWDVSPIIIEEFKLVLFTTPKIGTTVWKQLARRMMHFDDWRTTVSAMQDSSVDYLQLPHNPQYNGLRYLYHFSKQVVDKDRRSFVDHKPTTTTTPDEILTSPAWTRAIFVRDPIERLVSAYLDKAVLHDNGWYIKHHCCGFMTKPHSKDKNLMIKSITTPNGTITTTALSSSSSMKKGGSKSRRRLLLSSSSLGLTPPVISESFRQRIHHDHQARLAPGIRWKLPGLDLPPYCETLKSQDAEKAQEEAEGEGAMPSKTTIPFDVFVLEFLPVCDDPHWRPQSQRLDRHFLRGDQRRTDQLEPNDIWNYINFIGKFDTLEEDAKRLLQKVGAWNNYGSNGWGDGDDDNQPGQVPIFGSNTATHGTDAKSHVQFLFGKSRREVQNAVLDYYRDDYDHVVLRQYFNLNVSH